MFGVDITNLNAVLSIGKPYYFKLFSNTLVSPDDSILKQEVDKYLNTYASVVFDSPFHSDYIHMTLIPKTKMTLQNWIDTLSSVFKSLPKIGLWTSVSDAVFVSVSGVPEQNILQSIAGGVGSTLGTVTGEAAGGFSKGILSTLWPFLLAGGIGYLFFTNKIKIGDK